MSNLVAELFRIENSAALNACIPPFLSFLKWTFKAGPEQEELKRAVKAWFTRAQKPAKLIDADISDEMSPEEMEPMLSERIERWSKELIDRGRTEGMVEGKAEGMAEGELKGRTEGRRNLILKQLETRFGSLPKDKLSQLQNGAAKDLDTWAERLLTAPSLEDVFRR